MIGAGRRAATALGYDAGKLSAIEDKLGTAEMLRLFANSAPRWARTRSPGSAAAGFGTTPAAAKQQIADLKLDKGFMDKYLAGDKDAVNKLQRLMEAAHAGG